MMLAHADVADTLTNSTSVLAQIFIKVRPECIGVMARDHWLPARACVLHEHATSSKGTCEQPMLP